MGPTGFAEDVDPLTGLKVSDPLVLNRRPLVIKVQNLPREGRPQWGLSLADLVFEYYTELGSTRFAAVFYGQEAEKVGPVRSARFFDLAIVRMVQGVFVFGGAYSGVYSRLWSSDFYDRLIVEGTNSCPALCRSDAKDGNYLLANTREMANYLKTRGVNNVRQKLEGLFFKAPAPEQGKAATQVFVRYSGAIYNRWDYDPVTQKYLRFSDTKDDLTKNNESYAQLTDRLNNQPISATNVVILEVSHNFLVQTAETEVVDMNLWGEGAAYVLRDGQIYELKWTRPQNAGIVTLLDANGQPFPLKPGNTWFEVLGASSKLEQNDQTWRFTFGTP